MGRTTLTAGEDKPAVMASEGGVPAETKDALEGAPAPDDGVVPDLPSANGPAAVPAGTTEFSDRRPGRGNRLRRGLRSRRKSFRQR
jgi:hypothetical protein